MGMPVIVEIVGGSRESFERIFDYFRSVDERFSTYKPTSEVSLINAHAHPESAYSDEMREVLALAEETKQATRGYFDVRTPEGVLDPSGIVKGWAIKNAAAIARAEGYADYWVEAGGDIALSGVSEEGALWKVGIRNPFKRDEIVKVLQLKDCGIATSGTYIRGDHIYDPHTGASAPSDILSLTVIGPDVYEADRFATAAFAMGSEGIRFIESLAGFEGYSIDTAGMATMTSGFSAYVEPPSAK
jgi:thiamine biosynthesis lipoprotein